MKSGKMHRAMATAMALLFAAAGAAGAATLTVSSSGNGVFVLQGASMDGVAAMDLMLTYDASALANPRVTKGPLIEGAMAAENLHTPGTVRLAIIRLTPFSGSGTIATFTFDRTASAPGSITDLVVRLSDLNGRPLQASVQVQNPAVAFVDTQVAPPSAVPAPATSAPASPPAQQPAAAPVIVGVPVVRPEAKEPARQDERPSAPEERQQPRREPAVAKIDRPEASAQPDQPVPAQAPRASRPPAVYSQKSVLELFQAYTGERTPKALLALFDRAELIGFRQEPRVVFADGKQVAAVSFVTAPTGTGKPVVRLKSAKLVSLEKDLENTNTWVLKARADKGAVRAAVEVLQKDLVMVFPLTVAPRVNVDLDRSGKVTEEDFVLYLKEKGTAAAPKHDLNRDGKRDGTDDYIFAANYFAALLDPQPAKAAPAKPAVKATGRPSPARK